MKHAPQKEYVAHLNIGAGGSWARDSDPDRAAKRCAKIAYSDWKHLYKLEGAAVTIAVVDITGHDNVIFMDGRVYPEGGEEIPFPLFRKVELTLPAK